MWAWGSNDQWQLGIGDSTGTGRFAPVLAPNLSNVTDIEAAGGYYGSAFAITPSEAFATGFSLVYGQTGLGTSNQPVWKRVNLPPGCVKVRSTGSNDGVSTGGGHTLWLLSDGRVFAAGYNGYGQIGNNTTAHVTGDPIAVPGLSGIVDIWATGGLYGSSFASRADGAFFAWGCNGQGQLGLGDKINNKYTPIQNPRSNIVAVAGSSHNNYQHTVLLDNAGFAYATGYNHHGQCGVGTSHANSGSLGEVSIHKLMALPAGVQGTVIQVGTMGYSTGTASQLLDSLGRVWACGYNGGSMLGTGETNPGFLTVPARVRF